MEEEKILEIIQTNKNNIEEIKKDLDEVDKKIENKLENIEKYFKDSFAKLQQQLGTLGNKNDSVDNSTFKEVKIEIENIKEEIKDLNNLRKML